MDDLTPRITHDRGLWAATILTALTALVCLTLGAGFDMAGAQRWPVLDDIAHAAGWLALAGWITALLRGAHRAGADTGARVEAHVQSVREEIRTDRDRQAKEIAELREAVEAIAGQVEGRTRVLIDDLEERLAAEHVSSAQIALRNLADRNAARILPHARGGGRTS